VYTKIRNFLEVQKQRLLRQDGATEESDWLTEREQKGQDFVAVNEDTGKRKGLMEFLYDNSISWVMSQGHKALRMEFFDLMQEGAITEAGTTATSSSNITTFTTALLPAIKRIYSNLIAMDLVSVQPLSGPSGYIWWMDYKYGDAESTSPDSISAGDRLDKKQDAVHYTDSGEETALKTVYPELTSQLVQTETKKVATRWTIEAEQDLRSQWKLDIEAELMPELSNMIIREVDRKIIAALLAGAGAGNVNWSKSPPSGDSTTADKKAYYETLFWAIAEANAKIFDEKYRNADWLLMDTDTYYLFQRLENFNMDAHALAQTAAMGRRYVGTLGNIYKVYVDPWFTANKILLGIRGASWKESVAYYAPYIPLFLSPKYSYSNDFSQFIRGAMTRYAYGVIGEEKDGTTNNGLATVTITSS